MNPPRTRTRERILAHPAVQSESATLVLDLLVAAFAIVGAVLISLAR